MVFEGFFSKRGKGREKPEANIMPEGDLVAFVDAKTPGADMPAPDGKDPVVVLKAASATEKGHHDRNEDCARVGWWCDFYALSDGIGGAPDGDYMSRVSCGAALEDFETSRDVESAFAAGNRAACNVAKWIANDECGATLVVAGREGRRLRFAWAGDSALFRLRDGALLRLTSDGREDGSNKLTSAVGYDPDIVPMVAESSLVPGDVFIMCSDGVWSTLRDVGKMGDLMAVLSSGANVVGKARKICKDSAEIGYDDATAIVISVEESEPKTDEDDGDRAVEDDMRTPSIEPRLPDRIDRVTPLPRSCSESDADQGLAGMKTEPLPDIQPLKPGRALGGGAGRDGRWS